MVMMKILLALMHGQRESACLTAIDYLLEENRVLRNKCNETGKRLLLNDEQRRRLAGLARPVIRHGFRHVIQIFEPDTLMRWYRRLVAKKFDSSKAQRKVGRPEIPPHVSKLALKMARENRTWGCDRIAGALGNLGYQVSDQSVANVLRRHGLEPSPDRGGQGTWKQFLERHLDVLWATDFFNVEVLTMKGVVTYYVLFFVHLKTRKVVLGGITPNPNEAFMQQVARNVTGFDGDLEGARYLIRDRDTKYCTKFDEIMESAGIKAVKLPPRSPNLNAYAERFVRSIKEECLGKFIPMGERFLRYIIRQYLAHYHTERNHQGDDIGNSLLFPDYRIEEADPDGDIVTDRRLGGLLKFYHRSCNAA